MDFDTWIYIFFILISIIVPIVRNANKGKADSQDQESENPVQDIFEKLREQIKESQYQQFGDREEKKEPDFIVQDQPVVEIDDDHATQAYLKATEAAENPTYFSYDSEYENDKANETIRLQVEANASAPMFTDYSGTIDQDESGFEFEPVKAIIYSEILKRPEY